jgi:PncC family amidohydrolase
MMEYEGLHFRSLVNDTPLRMSELELTSETPVDSELLALSEHIGGLLRDRSWTCATAESCTGGGIAFALTSIAGSSEYVQGGIVAYSNGVKAEHLGVREATLATVGAVSDACCREMADGIRRALGVDVGISSTGIAGPGGATARKPVGLVYIGVATEHRVEVQELHLHGSRLEIMRAAIVASLKLVDTILRNGAEVAHETGA